MTRREDFLTVIVKFRISPAMAARLDVMMARAFASNGTAVYQHRAQLIRSLLLAIINDDAKAHGEKPLDEVA